MQETETLSQEIPRDKPQSFVSGLPGSSTEISLKQKSAETVLMSPVSSPAQAHSILAETSQDPGVYHDAKSEMLKQHSAKQEDVYSKRFVVADDHPPVAFSDQANAIVAVVPSNQGTYGMPCNATSTVQSSPASIYSSSDPNNIGNPVTTNSFYTYNTSTQQKSAEQTGLHSSSAGEKQLGVSDYYLTSEAEQYLNTVRENKECPLESEQKEPGANQDLEQQYEPQKSSYPEQNWQSYEQGLQTNSQKQIMPGDVKLYSESLGSNSSICVSQHQVDTETSPAVHNYKESEMYPSCTEEESAGSRNTLDLPQLTANAGMLII